MRGWLSCTLLIACGARSPLRSEQTGADPRDLPRSCKAPLTRTCSALKLATTRVPFDVVPLEHFFARGTSFDLPAAPDGTYAPHRVDRYVLSGTPPTLEQTTSFDLSVAGRPDSWAVSGTELLLCSRPVLQSFDMEYSERAHTRLPDFAANSCALAAFDDRALVRYDTTSTTPTYAGRVSIWSHDAELFRASAAFQERSVTAYGCGFVYGNTTDYTMTTIPLHFVPMDGRPPLDASAQTGTGGHVLAPWPYDPHVVAVVTTTAPTFGCGRDLVLVRDDGSTVARRSFSPECALRISSRAQIPPIFTTNFGVTLAMGGQAFQLMGAEGERIGSPVVVPTMQPEVDMLAAASDDAIVILTIELDANAARWSTFQSVIVCAD